jgi:hypothetical protein
VHVFIAGLYESDCMHKGTLDDDVEGDLRSYSGCGMDFTIFL